MRHAQQRLTATSVKRLITILSLSSAFLAVFTLSLVVVSLRRPIVMRYTLLLDGVVIVEWPVTAVATGREPLVESRGALGLFYLHRRLPPRPSNVTASFPNLVTVNLVSPLLLFSALPAVVYTRRFYRWYRARDLIAQGRCVQCGYDLRASKDRCPECGTPMVATGSKA